MNRQVIKNRIRKILVYTITAVLFLLISAFLILQMPPVQNYLVSRFLKNFTEVTGFPTTVAGFRMLWFDRLELTGVNVYDTEGNRMIGAREIMVNFKLLQLVNQRDINIDGIFIDSAHVFLTRVQQTDSSRNLNINVFIARINENFSSGGGGGNPPRINIGEAMLNQSQFTYVDQDRDTVQQGFDYNHFSLAVDEGQLRSFVVLGDTTEFEVLTLIAQDLKTKFKVNQLSTFFRISQQTMEFTGLKLQAGSSVISDTVIFSYKSQVDLSNFNERVKIHAHFDNTVIHPEDLALFAPGVEIIKRPMRVSGEFNGRVDKFKVSDMQLALGDTQLNGSLSMEGLPNLNETFIILNVRDSRLDPQDISFLFNERTLARLWPMGTVTMQGQFLGYPNDFVANGTFAGRLGTIRSDINFKVNEKDFDRSVYKGALSLINFDLGRYLGDTVVYQKVTLDGQVSGSGLTQNTADFDLNGKISSIGIKGYNYRNIRTDARFASGGLFRGFLDIDDPHLEMTARGSVDLRDGRNQIKLVARLDTAYLQELNLSRDSIFLHAQLQADLTGLSLDSLQGTADVNDVAIFYKDEWFKTGQVHLDAHRTAARRMFKIQSTLADVEATGDYYFSEISRDLQTLMKEISLNIRNDKEAIDTYYREKTRRPRAYEARIAVNLKDVRPVADLLDLNLKLSPNTHIDGRFTSGRTTILTFFSSFDSLVYEDKVFVKSDIELTTSKISDSTSVLSVATINSQQQVLGNNLRTRNLLVEAIWNRSHIDFGVDADHDGQKNYVRLKGGVDFRRDSTVIAMQPSEIQLLERQWTFAPDNFISNHGSDWTFNDVALVHNGESLKLNGQLSRDPSRMLSLHVDSLDLSTFNVLSAMKFKGVVDARIDLSNYYLKPAIQNNIHIGGLTVNDFLIGDITGKNAWDTTARRFDIQLLVDRNGSRIVNVDGNYNPASEEPLDLSAKLEKANLKIAEPFLKDIFSNIGGTVSGDFKITGPLQAPDIRGDGQVNDGQLMVTYLKTLYQFTGVIGLTPTTIDFKNIELTDIYRNKARLEGSIMHEGFSRMSIGVQADFRNFQVLNTSMKDNNLFYGAAYASGDVSFSGPLSNLKITSSARTEKNTHIYIPLSGSSSVDKKEFISFVNFRDTTFTKKIKDLRSKVNLTGITLDLNLDVTPEAYCEIIFDLKAGDIIMGRGNGDLKLQMDTKGEFNMFGPFEFTEGKYNFTLYDIINKEFIISKGSRITWYGDPYKATVDIKAIYNQLSSFAPLITDPTIVITESPQLQRRYPVQVLLTLEGPMLTPDINFDITAKDLPKNVQTNTRPINLDLEFTAFKNKLDEQELKRQVFSLIVLRRFSPPESLNTSGSVVNSLSELFSNQLSHWMSQVDEDLTIDVDVGAMDQESFNTFQLRLSYTFMNGRLRVTGDGTFNNSNNTPANSAQANPSSVAGDWTVDYMLTADGNLRVKMYSRTNVNPILSTVNNNQNTITTGASLIHTQSFNELKDLLQSARRKRKKLGEQQKKQDDGQDVPDFNSEAIREEDVAE